MRDDGDTEEQAANVDMVRASWSRELYRCRHDYEYLAKTYIKIQSKKRIASQTLTFNPVQRLLWDKMVDQKRRTGKIRQIWGKPRKIGATTLVRGMSFWLTAFHQFRKSLLVTHDEPSSYEVFSQNDLAYYRGLPPELQAVANYQSKARLSFYDLKSEVTAGHARDMGIGVTQTYDFHHITELARFRNAETIMNDALFPTLSEASAFDDNDWNCSVSVMESTSRHGGTFFKEFFEAARRGENEYEAVFIPAYLHADYQMPVPEKFRLTIAERALMMMHSLPIEHMVWRREAQAKYANTPALFRQNYPLTWEESWVLPQGTERVLSDAVLERMQSSLKPGTRMTVDERGLHMMVGGPIEVWEAPQPGVFYDAGLDIASGRGYDGDKTVMEIIRRDTLEQVAEIVTDIDPASIEFEDLVYWVSMVYNVAQLIPDVTGGWGWALLSAMQRRNYTNIWQRRQRDDVNERMSSKLGFYYSKQSKAELVNNMKILSKQRMPQVHSTYLYREATAFLEIEQGMWEGAPGSLDDAMNAYMLALMGSYDEQSGVVAEQPSVRETVWVPPYKSFDFDDELMRGQQDERFGQGGNLWT